jgi:hypothetical protein
MGGIYEEAVTASDKALSDSWLLRTGNFGKAKSLDRTLV